MKTRLLLGLLLLVGLGTVTKAQVQYSTERPRVEDANDPDVTIQRVDLTDQYTVIYMTFRAGRSAQGQGGGGIKLPDIFRFPAPNGRGRVETQSDQGITFVETARLYVNQGEKAFKFIRAENIPIERLPTDKRREVSAGERVDFVAYFERITPGYEVFDLFECSDRSRQNGTCFNFFGVHITNPAPRKRQPDVQARQTPPPASAPAPQTKPRYTPRTTPGYGNGSPDPVETKPVPEPEPAVAAIAMKGLVRVAKTQKPVVATITYRLLSGAETSGDAPADSVKSGKLAGNYQIAAEPLSVYALTVKAKGYFSQSDTLTITRADKLRNFDLVPIETGTKVTLKNIYFNVSKYDLKAESYPELDRLAQLMKENPAMNIRLEGHTDTVGEFDANVELSRNRVNEVRRYLASKGIDAGRIETIGYGPSRPINTNKSLKERPENRRVEMVITKS
ncbi:MAG: OmpA family protein [Rudanella sp.]|nr:OmpA family protein [Rudanella sp.]